MILSLIQVGPGPEPTDVPLSIAAAVLGAVLIALYLWSRRRK